MQAALNVDNFNTALLFEKRRRMNERKLNGNVLETFGLKFKNLISRITVHVSGSVNKRVTFNEHEIFIFSKSYRRE